MIEIINTGGTFNKIYNPLNGALEVPSNFSIIKEIMQKSLFVNQKIKLTQIISKDSLDFTKSDRKLLLKTIQNSPTNKIIVIHGTDTMKKSAKFISKFIKNKIVIFTGAMKPYEIEKVEAVANLFMGIGFLQNSKNGIYISMHGIVEKWDKIEKDYNKGVFLL
jgi:L-asparaginase